MRSTRYCLSQHSLEPRHPFNSPFLFGGGSGYETKVNNEKLGSEGTQNVSADQPHPPCVHYHGNKHTRYTEGQHSTFSCICIPVSYPATLSVYVYMHVVYNH